MQRREFIAGRGCAGANAPSLCSACGGQTTRRKIIALGAFIGSGFAFGTTRMPAESADERPKDGDQLVVIDAAELVALSPSDIPTSQILAWPIEPGSNLVRNGSRLSSLSDLIPEKEP
jgi:hypothetical protein